MDKVEFNTGDQAPSFEIYQGFWTNWSHGPIFGRTLTMSRENADLVIAFTGIFITFVGARFWRFVSMACHRFYSSPCPQGALHHQRQVVLRNSPSADSAFMTFVSLCWAWRRTNEPVFRHLYHIVLLSLLCAAGFVIAGGFSSRISTLVGSEVLLRGSGCGSLGYYQTDRQSSLDAYAAANAWSRQAVADAFNYARQCYSSSQSSTGTSCSVFVRPQLQGKQNTAASCPFQASLCRSLNENLLLDTGYLDSHFDFGLNSPPNERILIRNVLHCAPLATEGNMFTVNDTVVAFDYGPATAINMQGQDILMEYTYSVEDLRHQYDSAPPGSVFEADYRLIDLHAATVNGQTGSSFTSNGFEPDERLWRSDADISLYFLSSPGVVSSGLSEDPWFRMKSFGGTFVFSHGSDNFSVYRPDVPASPLACANQFKFCKTDKDHCGPLASFIDAVVGAAPAFGTTADMLTQTTLTEPVPGRFQRLAMTLRSFPIQFSTLYLGLGSDSLLVKQTLNNGVQGPLPPDQWQREMTTWWATALAGLQTFFVQTARGVSFPGLESYRTLEPVLSFEHDMCSNQASTSNSYATSFKFSPFWAHKILSTSHGSFSVFGLSFTYIVGAIVIMFSYILEPCLRWRNRRHLTRHKDLQLEHAGTYKDVEWTANNTLQLLRFAHENAGVEEWTRCDEDAPVLAGPGATPMCALDLQEPTHPRLSRDPMKAGMASGYPPDYATQEMDGMRPETCSPVDDSHQTTGIDADSSLEDDVMLPATSAACGGNESEWLGSHRPVSPLNMPDFRPYQDQTNQ